MADHATDHKWDLIDAVGRSPLFHRPEVPAGIDLAAVEQALLATDDLAAADRERLLDAVHELAGLYVQLAPAGRD